MSRRNDSRTSKETPLPSTSRTRVRRLEAADVPGKVTPLILLQMAAVAAVFGTLTIWHVHSVFGIRDAQMETLRVQQESARVRDESRDLRAQLARQETDEAMRRVAIERYGMVDAEPGQAGTVRVAAQSRHRWSRAAAEAEARFEAMVESEAKEVPPNRAR